MQRLDIESEWLDKVQRKAGINVDLGIATNGLIVRRDEKGDLIKVYQNMKNFCPTLAHALKGLSEDDPIRIDYAIDLLLQVGKLHSGEASITNTRYAHCDIKPDNILVDKMGKLRLIDFGLTQKNPNEEEEFHRATSGTQMYMPYNIFPDDLELTTQKTGYPPCGTPSYFYDDKIATLRTIYLDSRFGMPSIISDKTYESMPSLLKSVLNTNNIHGMLNQEIKYPPYPLKLIACALILYKRDPLSLIQEKINALMQDEAEQTVLIEQYQNPQTSQHEESLLINPSTATSDPKEPEVAPLILADEGSMKESTKKPAPTNFQKIVARMFGYKNGKDTKECKQQEEFKKQISEFRGGENNKPRPPKPG
jgi:serine/threonine protein kinase